MIGNKSADDSFKYFFSLFGLEKKALTFHANCLNLHETENPILRKKVRKIS